MTTEYIDHIVLCVPDLDAGIAYFQQKTAAKVFPGGKHTGYGTHNAIIRIGRGCYLEIIAKDPDNSTFTGKRWMGVDDVTDRPTVTRWAIKAEISPDNLRLLQQYNPELGSAIIGSRQMSDGRRLEWKMSVPLVSPKVECCPFLIDWGISHHPTIGLPQQCNLLNVRLHTSKPEKLAEIISAYNMDVSIMTSDEEKIKITMDTPKGQIVIS